MTAYRVKISNDHKSFVEVNFIPNPIRKGNNVHVESEDITERPDFSLYIPFKFKFLLYTEERDITGDWSGEIHTVVFPNDGRSMVGDRNVLYGAFSAALRFAFNKFAVQSNGINESLLITNTILPSVPIDTHFDEIAEAAFSKYIR